MNSIDFTQPNGFPLDQDILAFMQNAIFLSAGTAALGGTNYILRGCEQSGQNIGNGLVVIAGEILPFVGGALQEKVIILETFEAITYEDGQTLPSLRSKVATFGDDGVTDLLWTAFKRNTAEGVLARLERLERISAPFMPVTDTQTNTQHRGGMVLWKKPANLIPPGWQEVVDWRGRLPMGYDPVDFKFNEVGYNGGAKEKVINQSNLPTVLNVKVTQYNETGNGFMASGGNASEGDANIQIKNAGGGQALDVLNPYRVVIFIEYIGE